MHQLLITSSNSLPFPFPPLPPSLSIIVGKLVQKLTKPHTESVESIAFSPAVGVISLLATGSVDGFVKIWNTANWQVRTALQHPAAIVKIMWHPKKQVLFTACNDNIIRYVTSRRWTIPRF